MRFSKRAFKVWLEKHSSHYPVGIPISRAFCPLCLFIRAEQGIEDVTMMPINRWVNGKFISNPKWARKFQHNAMNHVEYLTWKHISAEAALTCLR